METNNYSGNLDELFQKYQPNIEHNLRDLLHEFEARIDITSTNRACMTRFFDVLRHRMTIICQNVQSKRTRAEQSHQSDKNEIKIDDYMSDVVLMKEFGTFKQTEATSKMSAMADVLNNVEEAPSVSSSADDVVQHQSVSEADIDSFLNTKRSHFGYESNESESKRSEFVEEAAESPPRKKQCLAAPCPTKSTDMKAIIRPTSEMAKRLRRQTYTMLRSEMNSVGRIIAFCFFCEDTLEMDLERWRSHILQHTDETEFYCTGCNTPLTRAKPEHCPNHGAAASFNSRLELNAFMCCYCDYMQVNEHRVIEHIKTHHEFGNNALNCMDKVLLLPDLRDTNTPIGTTYACVSASKRYQCGVRNCGQILANPAHFKKHFLMYHGCARSVLCPHCHQWLNGTTNLFHVVLTHAYLHGCIICQCPECDAILTSDFNIISHMLADHSNRSLKYQTDIRTDKKLDRMQFQIILFECNVCKECIDSPDAADVHFLRMHKSHGVDFTIRKFTRRTWLGNDGKITKYDIDSERGILQYAKHLICVLCNKIFRSRENLINHHSLQHRFDDMMIETSMPELTLLRDIPNHSKIPLDQYLLYYCGHCADPGRKNGLIFCNIDDVYEHWLATHSKHRHSEPFRFKVAQLAFCRYCNVISTFEGLLKHQIDKHTSKEIAIENVFDRSKCGVCLAKNCNGGHFAENHDAILESHIFSPIAIDRDILQMLVKYKTHKLRKCEQCDEVFTSNHSFLKHHLEKHPHELERKSEKFYDNFSVHLSADCCDSKISVSELFKHLDDHGIKSKADIQKHCSSTQIVFGNGLILYKINILDTQLDYSIELDMFIKSI